MGELVDPRNASIDGLIDWLRAKRRCDPVSRLSDLIEGHEFDEQRLVDIACIDLMLRQRMEHAVNVESYLKEFPCLRSESNQLDLIDAELCVATELGSQIDLNQYLSRFPELADQVRELFQLEVGGGLTSALINVGDVVGGVDDAGASVRDVSPSQADDFSVDVLPSDAAPQRVVSLTDHPLDVPDWFIVAQCVGSGPGRWLIRGRDSVRGIALALKVTELPAQLSSLQGKQILDACEVAANVRNPSWVPPSVAAIQQRHLGVIRQWLFARPWQQCKATHDHCTQLRNLASVAFAVESAHQIGATHGGIHVENLMVDHAGKVQVLDAGSSRIGLERWLHPRATNADSEQIASLDERIGVDLHDLIKLVASASVDWEQEWTTDLVAELQQIAKQDSGKACGEVGQTLIRCADSVIPSSGVGRAGGRGRRSWRKRLARWIDREA